MIASSDEPSGFQRGPLSPAQLRAAAVKRQAEAGRYASTGYGELAASLTKVAIVLRALAAARETDGTILPELRTAKDVERAVRTHDPALNALGGLPSTPSATATVAAAQRARKIAEAMEHVGEIEGYHPTPPSLADRVVEEAGILPHHRVLEPSAGSGNLADAVRRAGAEPDVVERMHRLRDVLEAKGYSVVGDDALALDRLGPYDRIVMNPPFERGAEIDHVQHAYTRLAPGGALVAIMSEGPFFRGDKKSAAFRAWLERVGGSSERLPEQSFKRSERTTGVATRLVVVERGS